MDRRGGITDWQRKERGGKRKEEEDRKIMMTGVSNVSQAEVRYTGEKMDFRKKVCTYLFSSETSAYCHDNYCILEECVEWSSCIYIYTLQSHTCKCRFSLFCIKLASR